MFILFIVWVIACILYLSLFAINKQEKGITNTFLYDSDGDVMVQSKFKRDSNGRFSK